MHCYTHPKELYNSAILTYTMYIVYTSATVSLSNKWVDCDHKLSLWSLFCAKNTTFTVSFYMYFRILPSTSCFEYPSSTIRTWAAFEFTFPTHWYTSAFSSPQSALHCPHLTPLNVFSTGSKKLPQLTTPTGRPLHTAKNRDYSVPALTLEVRNKGCVTACTSTDLLITLSVKLVLIVCHTTCSFD